MATKLAKQVPSVKNWGGIRSVERRLERSQTILANKEAVAYELLCMANTKLSDIMTWDEEGNVKVKASKDIPDHAMSAPIRKAIQVAHWTSSSTTK